VALIGILAVRKKVKSCGGYREREVSGHMLGRTNESAGAWDMLLDEWVEIGGKKEDLHGLEWATFITLTVRLPESVGAWTK